MTDILRERKHNPELLRNALNQRCKLLWSVALITKFAVFAAGAILVVVPSGSKALGITAIVLGLVSEGFMWWSDRWKGASQELHRKLDFENAFGWVVTNKELVDILARFPGKLDPLCGDTKGSYFASEELPGPKRGLQNLRESSWWSMHLAESMGWVFVVTIVLIIAGCVLLLNLSIGSLPVSAGAAIPAGQKSMDVVGDGIIKIVTSSLLFIVSYGLLRFAAGYFAFASKSKAINQKAEDLIESECSDTVQVIKLWQDYHLARALAPMLPTWIWTIRQERLNELFRDYLAVSR